MKTSMIVALALLSTVATASASSTGDWPGAVKVQASYNDPTYSPTRKGLEVAVDVSYDKTGGRGKAWGTFSLMSVEDTTHNIAANALYYHAICVGKFLSDRWSVAGVLVKSVGLTVPQYMTFEFDTNGTGWRTIETASLKDARATCNAQSGVYPGVFHHGFFNAS